MSCTGGDLLLVPWKHVWASVLSNVVLVGAYWWSFFAFNLIPVQSGVVIAESKLSELAPVLVEDRKPPDLLDLDYLSSEEMRYCYEVLAILLLLAKEGHVYIPVPILLLCSVLLLSYMVYKDG